MRTRLRFGSLLRLARRSRASACAWAVLSSPSSVYEMTSSAGVSPSGSSRASMSFTESALPSPSSVSYRPLTRYEACVRSVSKCEAYCARRAISSGEGASARAARGTANDAIAATMTRPCRGTCTRVTLTPEGLARQPARSAVRAKQCVNQYARDRDVEPDGQRVARHLLVRREATRQRQKEAGEDERQ